MRIFIIACIGIFVTPAMADFCPPERPIQRPIVRMDGPGCRQQNCVEELRCSDLKGPCFSTQKCWTVCDGPGTPEQRCFSRAEFEAAGGWVEIARPPWWQFWRR